MSELPSQSPANVVLPPVSQPVMPETNPIPTKTAPVKKKNFLLPIIVVILALLLIGLGAFFFLKSSPKQEADVNIEPSPTPTLESPLPSQVPDEQWQSYTTKRVAEYHQPYTIFYPKSWQLDTSSLDKGVPRLVLTNNDASITITQGPMGAGGCLYPEDEPYDGMVSYYGKYQQITKGNLNWRVAQIKDIPEVMVVVCEEHTNGYAALTSIGMVELRMKQYDQEIVDEFIQILTKLELVKDGVSSQATVEGKVCYPSEFIPGGKVVAKNVTTNEMTKQDNPANSGKFTLNLNPGTYVFAYLPDKNSGFEGGVYDGFYTKCATTMMNTDCDDLSEHQLIKVILKAGQTNDEVSLCDWYHTEEMTPKF